MSEVHNPDSTPQNRKVALSFLENADGVSATGKEYHNQYHDLIEVRGDGQIHAGREYLDTAHAQEVIVGGARGRTA